MASNIPVIVQGNSFSLAIPLQIYYIDGDQMDLQDYTPDPTDDVTVQLKGSRRNYTYTPTIDGNVANIDLTGNELADNYAVMVSIVKDNGQRLRSFRTDQFFIVESSDDLTTDDIIQGLEENVIYLNSSIFIAGEDGRGIEGIQKTGTSGLVDTYTIYYSDNTTSTFTVTNGAQGEAGATIAGVEKTATVGKVDTYTITMTNGSTFDFEVTNGLDGVDLGLANIVDDLTTGGSTNVLSAEMGKELAIASLATTAEDLAGTSERVKARMIADGWELDKYTDGEGNITSQNGYCITPYLPIGNLSGHNIVFVYRFDYIDGRYAYCAYFNENKVRVHGTAFNTNQSRVALNLGSNVSTAKYLRASFNMNNIANCLIVDLTTGVTIFDGRKYLDSINGNAYVNNERIERVRAIPTPYANLNQWVTTNEVTQENNYSIYAVPVCKGDVVEIFAAQASNQPKNARYSFNKLPPQAGVALENLVTLSSVTQVSEPLTAPYDGYLYFSHATASFAAQYFNIRRTVTKDGDTERELHASTLPLDGLVNGSRYQDWTPSDSTNTAKTSAMLVPYDGVMMRFKIDAPNVYCRVKFGNIVSGTSTSTNTEPFTDNATFKVAEKIANICIIFNSVDGSNLSPATIQELVDGGAIKITYYNKFPDVFAKNINCDAYTKAAMLRPNTDSSKAYLHNIPVIAHASDIHGDWTRLNDVLRYCDYLGVDMLINTGDTACNKGSDGFATYNGMVAKLKTQFPTLVCEGNHDGWYPDYGGVTQNEKIYADLIQPNATAFGYNLPSASDYESAPTYYYVDNTKWKLRVIALNQYESGLQSWSQVGRISQKQIDWLIATLASTPQDYGVILFYHDAMSAVDKDNDYPKFYAIVKPSTVTITLSNDPLGKIIDAFISKTSASGSYNQKNNGVTETVNWSADFTSLNSGVEFICHLNGHRHRDYVGYYHGTTNLQLVLTVTTAQSLYGFTHVYKANDDELPRGCEGATDDAFNVYGIDRTEGVIKVARVGSNITAQMTPRDYMIIPYK